MPVLSKINTLLRSTLFIFIMNFLLRPFSARHSPPASAASQTPRPLTLDLENGILGLNVNNGMMRPISHHELSVTSPLLDSVDVVGHARDRVGQTSYKQYIVKPQTLKDSRPVGTPAAHKSLPVVPTTSSNILYGPSKGSSFHKTKYRMSATPRPALAIAPNFVHTPVSARTKIPSYGKGENVDPATSQAPRRKPTPLRRMPRYLNLTGASPTRTTQKTPESKARRRSLVRCLDGASPTKYICIGRSPCIAPLKLELNPEAESVDLGARIKSVFYKHREHEEDDVRNFFARGSDCSEVALEQAMLFAKDLNSEGSHEEKEDKYEVYRAPFSFWPTCIDVSPSISSSSDTCSVPGFVLPTPGFSELPYLHFGPLPSVSDISASSSSSSFNDLLASVDRKYAGMDWEDMVQIGDEEDSLSPPLNEGVYGEYKEMNPYSGIVEEEDEDRHWSDVVCLGDYYGI
ncbi:hypothetical protein B0H10DRAFT_2232636 [Mycena sp. CBHHK59/15]|nr:hypothetical protein B0H10DRAFT_2232636 [Mycena sp. CBHHK59/15]